jgi:hypothetical protein
MVVGRQYVLSPFPVFRNWRSPIEFTVPADLTTCEDAYLDPTGLSDFSDVDFNVLVVAGSWADYTKLLDGTAFNDFTGWASSGDYSPTVYNETFSTSEYVSGHNYIRGNAAFRAYLVSNAGQTIKLMLLSENDSTWTGHSSGPAGNEFIQFESSSARLELRYNSKTLHNQTVELYLAYEPIPASHTDMELLWKGVIDNYSIDDTKLSLKCVTNHFKKDITIPNKIITLTDWPNCPESNIGKAYPIIYGEYAETTEHLPGVGNFYGSGPSGIGTYNYSYPDCFEVLVTKEDALNRSIIFSNQQMKSASKALFTWNSSMKAFELFPHYTGAITWTWAAGKRSYRDYAATTNVTNFPDILCEQGFSSLVSIVPNKYDAVAITDPTKAYDSDSATYAIMTGNTSKLTLYFPAPQGVTGNSVVAYVVYLDFQGGADPTKSNFAIEKDDSTTLNSPHWVGIDIIPGWAATGQYVYAFYLLDSTSTDRDTIRLPQFRIIINRTDNTGTVRIKDVCAVYAYAANDTKVFYSCGQGNYYGSWIDSAGRSNSYNANDLIENPSGAIESLSRDEIGFATADIDTAGFDTASTALSAWKYAFQVIERKKSSEYLHDLLVQCRSKGWYDNQDRLTMKPFNSTNGFANSGTDIPGALDIFDLTGEPSGETFTHIALIESPTITAQNMSEVYNDFTLHYKLNYAANQYAEVLTCNSTATSLLDANLEGGQTAANLITLCSESLTSVKTTNTDEYNAWAVRDLATASKLLQYRIERKTKRRYYVEMTAVDTAIRFIPGDFVNIRTDRIYELFGNAVTERKKWEILEVNYVASNSTVKIKCIEV